MNELQHLFIDESGKADLLNKQYSDFILCGVLIGNPELSIISGYFSFIKRKYKLPEHIPFHTYDLLENSYSSYKLKTRQIPMFVQSMQEFLQLIPLVIYVVHIHKPSFMSMHAIEEKDLKGSQENKQRNGVLYYLSSVVMLSRVTKRLELQNTQCAIHVDSRKYLDNQLLKAFIDIKEPTLRTKNGNQNNFVALQAKRLCSIEFANKTALSAGLELADFVSYVTFANIRNQAARLHVDAIWPYIQRKLSGRKYTSISKSLGKLYV